MSEQPVTTAVADDGVHDCATEEVAEPAPMDREEDEGKEEMMILEEEPVKLNVEEDASTDDDSQEHVAEAEVQEAAPLVVDVAPGEDLHNNVTERVEEKTDLFESDASMEDDALPHDDKPKQDRRSCRILKAMCTILTLACLATATLLAWTAVTTHDLEPIPASASNENNALFSAAGSDVKFIDLAPIRAAPPRPSPVLKLGEVAASTSSGNPAQKQQKNAVVSLLLSDDNSETLRVLAHSLRMVNCTADLVLAYIPELVSERTLCRVSSYGWTLRPVRKIYPVVTPTRGLENLRYFWSFTKLRIWSWTEYDKVLFLDADTLALRNFDELFNLPVEFASVLDVWPGRIGPNFNVGVMLIHPSIKRYHTLLEQMYLHEDSYDVNWVEQAFLNHHFETTVHLIPFIYNLNLALVHHPELLSKVWGEASIVHYTLEKPFAHDGSINRIARDHRLQAMFDSWFIVRDDMLAQKGGGADDECLRLDGSVAEEDPIHRAYSWSVWRDHASHEALHIAMMVLAALLALKVLSILSAAGLRRMKRLWKHSVAVVLLPIGAVIGKPVVARGCKSEKS